MKKKVPTIIFEDSSVLVISKPPYLVVNRALSVKGETVQDWVESRDEWKKMKVQKSWEENKEFFSRSGVVHRLDKETSGVMIVAKTVRAYKFISKQFADRKVRKTYLALVHGKLKPDKGTMRLPLARNRADRERFAVALHGKKAETSWQVKKFYSKVEREGVSNRVYQGFSLLEVKPLTGRTHQIRVHMSHLRHPIVGDTKYLSKRRIKEDLKWCERLFLHAFAIKFYHPESDKYVVYKSNLADDLSRAMQFLKEPE